MKIALSVMEIHADSISDLLSSEPHRRLEVKKVRNIAISMNVCQVKYPYHVLTGRLLCTPCSPCSAVNCTDV